MPPSAVHTRVTKVSEAMPTQKPTRAKRKRRSRAPEMPQKRAASGDEPKAMTRRPVTVRRRMTHAAPNTATMMMNGTGMPATSALPICTKSESTSE